MKYMLNWNYLETFVILAETLSFSQTAKVLNTAQPGISRQIKVLETSLGYPLFIRSKKKVALSPQGALLKLQLGPLVGEIKGLLYHHQETGNTLSGAVRIGSIMEAGQLIFYPKIKELMKLHPELQVHFIMKSSKDINQAVLDGELDFGFVYQVTDRKALQSQVVFQDTAVLVGDKSVGKKWLEEKSQALIGYREKDHYTVEFIERNFFKSDRGKFSIQYSINSHNEMIDFLKFRPDTRAVMPLSSAQQALGKNQIQILSRDRKPQNLYFICNEQTLIDKRKKKFWEMVAKAFA